MNSVYHPHAAAFDKNRWQWLVDLGKPGYVPLVLPFRARRITGYEGGNENSLGPRSPRCTVRPSPIDCLSAVRWVK